MDQLKPTYTTTFLRTALVNDPFCLGDLGPEDVLRIESEFPDLFTSSFQETRNDDTEFQKMESPKKPEKPKSVRTEYENVGSPKKFDLHKVPRTMSPINIAAPPHYYQTHGRNICSRGDRCVSAGHHTTVPQVLPHRKGLNRFPLRKALIPNKDLPTTPLKQSSSITPTNVETHKEQKHPRGLKISRNVNSVPSSKSLILPPLPLQSRTKFPLQVNHGKSDNNLLNLNGTEKSEKCVKLACKKSNDPRLVILHSIEQEKRRPGTESISRLKTSTTLRNPATNNSNKMKNQTIGQPKVDVKFPKRVNKFANGDQVPAIQGDFVGSELPFEHSDGSSSGNSSSSDIIFIDSDSDISDKKESHTVEIQKPQTPHKDFSHQVSRNEEVGQVQNRDRDSIGEEEQIILTRLLATKYEKDGKFQKTVGATKLQSKKGASVNSISSHNDIVKRHDLTLPSIIQRTSILETLTEELIRAEILKHIQQESINQKTDACVETGSDFEDYQTCQKCNADTIVNNKKNLSTIDEENDILLTPELTPPDVSQFQQHRRINRGQPINVTEYDPMIKTPEITPPSTNARSRRKSLETNNRAKLPCNPNNGNNDITDCSSFSDFIFSDNEKFQQNNYNSQKFTKITEFIDISTPSRSSPTSSSTKKYSLSKLTSLSTPTKSHSQSQSENEDSKVVYTKITGLDKLTQTDLNPRAKKSRSKVSLSGILSELDTSPKSSFKYPTSFHEGLSEGEFLLTPYKSNGEISLASFNLSPGLYFSKDMNQAENDTTDNECLSSILEINSDEVTLNETFSDGEAPLSTAALLSKVEHLLQ